MKQFALSVLLSHTSTHTNRCTHLSVIVSLSPLATPFITVLAFGVRTTWETKKVPFLLQETHQAFTIAFCGILCLHYIMMSAAVKCYT